MIDNLSKIYLSHKNVPTYDITNMFLLIKKMESAMICVIERNEDKEITKRFKEILQIGIENE